MAEKLAVAGVEHELLTVAGAGHGLSGIETAERERIDARAVAFIRAHLS
jgi:hypothetical protein